MKIPWRVLIPGALVMLVMTQVFDTPFVAIVAFPLILAIAWRQEEQSSLERWARARGIEITPSVARELERYFWRRQRFGTAGGVFALIVVYAYLAVASGPIDWAIAFSIMVPIFAVNLAVQMVAERTYNPKATGTVRRAEILNRGLSDYVPMRLVGTLRALGALVLLVSLLGIAFLDPGEEAFLLLTIGIASALFALGVEWAQRWRARWPLPLVAPAANELQNELRADAIRIAMWSGVLATTGALTAVLTIISRHIEMAGARLLPVMGVVGLSLVAVGAFRSEIRESVSPRRRRLAQSG